MAGIEIVLFVFCIPWLFSSVGGERCIEQVSGFEDYIIDCPRSGQSADWSYCCGPSDNKVCCDEADYFGVASSNGSDGLTVGQIIGIVIGCVIIVIIIVALAFAMRKLKVKLDERMLERNMLHRRSMNRNSINREHPNRGSFKRTSLRVSSRRHGEMSVPLNTTESAVFSNGGLTNPGFEETYNKPVGRTGPIMNNDQNGQKTSGRNTPHTKDSVEIVGLDESPKMYDKRRHFEEMTDAQQILQLEESPKMNERWQHTSQPQSHRADEVVHATVSDMDAQLRYHQLQEQHKLKEVSKQIFTNQYNAPPEHADVPADAPDSHEGKKKKKSKRNLPIRIRDSAESKWSIGYTRETVIQLKRNPSTCNSSCNSSKDFDPENPPGILRNRDYEISDFDSVLGDSMNADDVFDGRQHTDASSRDSKLLDNDSYTRSPSPKQTLAVAPYRQTHSDRYTTQTVPFDQPLTLDASHLKAQFPSHLSPSQLSPTGRDGMYSYFSPNEDFEDSFAKSYPEFVQSKANQPRGILPPKLHIHQNGRHTPTDISNDTTTAPKQYIDYNRAGEELTCTSL